MAENGHAARVQECTSAQGRGGAAARGLEGVRLGRWKSTGRSARARDGRGAITMRSAWNPGWARLLLQRAVGRRAQLLVDGARAGMN